MKTHQWAVVVALLVLVSAPAEAALDLQGTRSLGMGGALRAAPAGESAMLLNPAGLRLTNAYMIFGLYQFRVSDNASLVNTSIMDSTTSGLAAGVFYSFSHASPSRHVPYKPNDPLLLQETIETHETGLSLAYVLFSRLYVGLTAKYVHYDLKQIYMPYNTLKDTDPPIPTADVVSIDTFTIDVGAIIQLFDGLHIGVVGYNLIPVQYNKIVNNIPIQVNSDAFPLSMGLGISYMFGQRLLAEFDAVMDFTTEETITSSFHGGAELYLGDMFALRGGVIFDTKADNTYVTGGLGFVYKKIGLDFGMRQMVDGGAETLIAFSIRMFLM